jgi:ABC-type amino acid transport substrate-binding protein
MNRTIIRISYSIALILVLLSLPGTVLAQEKGVASRPLLVGAMVFPPLMQKTAQGGWTGFSAEIWQAVAQQMNVQFAFREYNSLESMLSALEKNEIDLIPSLQVRGRFEPTIDFSNSYLKSGLSIAVSADGEHTDFIRVFVSIFSGNNLHAITSLIVVSLLAGIIIWSFERRHNSEMFGDSHVRGVSNGIWWAIVTMTTVGYGDKAPKTIGGRAFALIWMIFSIIFISCFTANITSQLTVSEFKNKVQGFNDLYKVKAGCVAGSEGFDFLSKQGVAVIPFGSVHEGLLAIANKKIDAFVQDEILLKNLVKSEFPGRLQVVSGTFDEYFVSMALPLNSQFRKPINKALHEYMKTPHWAELLNRHVK